MCCDMSLSLHILYSQSISYLDTKEVDTEAVLLVLVSPAGAANAASTLQRCSGDTRSTRVLCIGTQKKSIKWISQRFLRQGAVIASTLENPKQAMVMH